MGLTPEERRAVVEYIFGTMRARGVTKAWLARQLGVSRNAVQKYFEGRAMPMWVVPRACEALGIPTPILPTVTRTTLQFPSTWKQEARHDDSPSHHGYGQRPTPQRAATGTRQRAASA